MKKYFLLIALGSFFLNSFSQNAPLSKPEFYEQLFNDYPESFYKLDTSKSPTSNTILERDVWFNKNGSDSILHFKMKMMRNSDYTLILNYKFIGALKKGLVQNKNLTYPDKSMSFIDQLVYSYKVDLSPTFSGGGSPQQASPTVDAQQASSTLYPLNKQASSTLTLPNSYLEVKSYNEALRWYKRKDHWLAGISICSGVNYRRIEVNNNQYTNIAAVNKRNAGETYQASVPFGFYFGRGWGHHQLTFGFTNQSFGYDYAESQKDSLSWLKGSYSDTKFSVPRTRENQKVYSYGLFYSYSAHKPGPSFFFLCGVNTSFRANGKGLYVIEEPSTKFTFTKRANSINSAKQAYNFFAFNFKLGAGLSIKPNYRTDFRVYPVLYYGLNSIKGTELNTRFYTLGLEAGFFIKLGQINSYGN